MLLEMIKVRLRRGLALNSNFEIKLITLKTCKEILLRRLKMDMSLIHIFFLLEIVNKLRF